MSTIPVNKINCGMGPIKLVYSAFEPDSSTAVFPFLIPSGFFTITDLERTSRVIRGVAGSGMLTSRLLTLDGRICGTLRACTIIGRPGFNGVCTFRVSNFKSTCLDSSTGIPGLLTLPCLNNISDSSTVCTGAEEFI